MRDDKDMTADDVLHTTDAAMQRWPWLADERLLNTNRAQRRAKGYRGAGHRKAAASNRRQRKG